MEAEQRYAEHAQGLRQDGGPGEAIVGCRVRIF